MNMDPESIIGLIIMLLCCWGCGAIFTGIGIHALQMKTPIHFWAGSVIDPDSVSDIAAYNRENSRMWVWYSVPYWLAGVIDLLGGGRDPATIGAAIVLFLAFLPGMPILIANYKRISRKYMKLNEDK